MARRRAAGATRLGRGGSTSMSALQRLDPLALHPLRGDPGEQLVEHRAQRVDVGRRGDRLAAHLLRARVLRREQAHPRARRRLPPGGGVEELGDAEVEELGLALDRDQDVARLEVAVHDELLVGVGHRGAHLAEELHPRRHVEAARLGPLGDGRADDVLHHEVGEPLLGAPPVEEPHDARVLQRGQDLPLVAEARHGLGGRRARRGAA